MSVEFYAVFAQDFEKFGHLSKNFPIRNGPEMVEYLRQMDEENARSVAVYRAGSVGLDAYFMNVTREIAAQMAKDVEFNWDGQKKCRDYRSAVMWVDGFTKIWAEDELEARFNEEYNDSFEV